MGGPALLQTFRITVPEQLRRAAQEAARRGQSAIYLTDQSRALVLFAVADVVRPESHDAVRLLHQRGVQVVMMTGDARAVADSVATELGIDVVFSEVLPEQKSAKIEELKRTGKRVGMVGDGVNDAPDSLLLTLALQSEQAQTWRSRPETSCLFGAILGTCRELSISRKPATAR